MLLCGEQIGKQKNGTSIKPYLFSKYFVLIMQLYIFSSENGIANSIY